MNYILATKIVLGTVVYYAIIFYLAKVITDLLINSGLLRKLFRISKGLTLFTLDSLKGWISGIKYVIDTKEDAVYWNCTLTFFSGGIEEMKEKRRVYREKELEFLSEIKKI